MTYVLGPSFSLFTFIGCKARELERYSSASSALKVSRRKKVHGRSKEKSAKGLKGDGDGANREKKKEIRRKGGVGIVRCVGSLSRLGDSLRQLSI